MNFPGPWHLSDSATASNDDAASTATRDAFAIRYRVLCPIENSSSFRLQAGLCSAQKGNIA
jgi:hypothetical protein